MTQTLFKNSGIYSIGNLVNDKMYIGQAICLKTRKRKHFYNLRKGTHENNHFQKAFSKYGEKHFSFNILVLCEPFELTRYEQFFVDNLEKNKLYNIRTECVDSNRGIKFSEKAKDKISKAATGRVLSEKTKNLMREAKLGKKLSLETIEKMRKAKQNQSLNTIEKMRKAKTGIKNPMFGKKKKESSSVYHGVYKNKGSWCSQIRVGKNRIFLGVYKEEREAGLAYNKYVTENKLPNPLNKFGQSKKEQ